LSTAPASSAEATLHSVGGVRDALMGFTSRLDFPSLLTQDTRLLRVSTALPELALLPERLVMREALSQPYELTLDALSTTATLRSRP
jgi:hypothetical protein